MRSYYIIIYHRILYYRTGVQKTDAAEHIAKQITTIQQDDTR